MVWHRATAKTAAKGRRPRQPKRRSLNRGAASTASNAPTLGLGRQTARANMDAAEYKHIVLGLIFIKVRLRRLPGAPQEL